MEKVKLEHVYAPLMPHKLKPGKEEFIRKYKHPGDNMTIEELIEEAASHTEMKYPEWDPRAGEPVSAEMMHQVRLKIEKIIKLHKKDIFIDENEDFQYIEND